MTPQNFFLPDRLAFLDSTLLSSGRVIATVIDKGEVDGGMVLLEKSGGSWSMVGDVPWRNGRLYRPGDGYVAATVGEVDGVSELCLVTDDSFEVLEIPSDPEFTPRGVLGLGNQHVVYGHGGVIYILSQDGRWRSERYSAETENSLIESGAVGPNGSIWLVGPNGGGWCRDEFGWVELDLPSNSNFRGICHRKNSEAWVCGGQSTVLAGNAGSWTVVPEVADLEQEFWGIHEFGGRVWLSTVDHAIYLEDGTAYLDDFAASVGVDHYFTMKQVGDELLVTDERCIAAYDGESLRLLYND